MIDSFSTVSFFVPPSFLCAWYIRYNAYSYWYFEPFGTNAGACINECAATRRNKHPQPTDQPTNRNDIQINRFYNKFYTHGNDCGDEIRAARAGFPCSPVFRRRIFPLCANWLLYDSRFPCITQESLCVLYCLSIWSHYFFRYDIMLGIGKNLS